MRKFLMTAVFVVLCLAPFAPPVNAQGFILGMIVGSSMSGNSVQGDAVANNLYTAPRVSERVKDPLDMRIAYTRATSDTLREQFSKIFRGDGGKYEILQVTRTADQGNANVLYLWFVYIEKEKVIPLDQLPKQAAQ